MFYVSNPTSGSNISLNLSNCQKFGTTIFILDCRLSFHMLFLNVRGINDIFYGKDFLSSLDVHIICLSEHWLQSNDLIFFNSTNYNLDYHFASVVTFGYLRGTRCAS